MTAAVTGARYRGRQGGQHVQRRSSSNARIETSVPTMQRPQSAVSLRRRRPRRSRRRTFGLRASTGNRALLRMLPPPNQRSRGVPTGRPSGATAVAVCSSRSRRRPGAGRMPARASPTNVRSPAAPVCFCVVITYGRRVWLMTKKNKSSRPSTPRTEIIWTDATELVRLGTWRSVSPR